VRLIGYYDKPSCVCLVTELCEKGTLADFAKKNKMICKSLAKRFALELGLFLHSYLFYFFVFHFYVCDERKENALRTVHQRGFLHRDIKPENCFICEDSDSYQLKLGYVMSIHIHTFNLFHFLCSCLVCLSIVISVMLYQSMNQLRIHVGLMHGQLRK